VGIDPPDSTVWPPPVRALLYDVRSAVGTALGARLRGLYLYGSLVTGDFDSETSDVDVLAVTDGPLDAAELARLDAVHSVLVERHPAWLDRMEIAYIGAAGIADFPLVRPLVALISPGEPFHTKRAGYEWLLNWHVVRTHGVTLLGPRPATFIPEITAGELRAAVRLQAQDWREYVHSARHPGFQAFAVFTACRALYTDRHGEVASKIASARWAREEFPEWADLIDRALVLRSLGGQDGVAEMADLARTARFVHAVADLLPPS
jgi:hypothetical protein